MTIGERSDEQPRLEHAENEAEWIGACAERRANLLGTQDKRTPFTVFWPHLHWRRGSIRPITLNRKNALFAGSDGGGENWAILASLIETCKLSRVNPQAYLADALTKIVNGHLNSQIDDLLPWAYATQDEPLREVAWRHRLRWWPGGETRKGGAEAPMLASGR
jgi:hypothetical protein